MTTPEAFLKLTAQLSGTTGKSYILAELSDLLTAASADDVLALPRPEIPDLYLENYVAAMVDQAAHNCRVVPPLWPSLVAPLRDPVFAVPWQSLRAHLLLESPIAFRRDTSVAHAPTRAASRLFSTPRRTARFHRLFNCAD